MPFIKKRHLAIVCAGLGTLGTAGAFAFSGTGAQFTSLADNQHNQITAGTVVLTENASASKAYDITNLMPGDGSCYSAPTGALYTCDQPRNEYALTYSGTGAAFVGLDIKVTSTAAQACTGLAANTASVAPAAAETACTGTGQLPLFDGVGGAGDLDLALTPENGDTAHQLVLDTDLVTHASCSTNATDIVVCTSEIDNVMMPVAYGSAANAGLQWTTGSTDFVQVDTALPSTAGNQFQGGSVSIDLQSHAVQWANNNTTKGSASPTCAAGTTFPQGLSAATVPCPITWS